MDDKRWKNLLNKIRTDILVTASLIVWATACAGSLFLGQLSRTLRLAMGAGFSGQDLIRIMFFSFSGAIVSIIIFTGLMYLASDVSAYNDLLAWLLVYPFGLPKPVPIPPIRLPGHKAKPIPSEYPPEFNDTLKREIRERDAYTCAICSRYGNQIHHINYDKTDTRFENLVTLCPQCHGETNGNRGFWESTLSPIATERTKSPDSTQLSTSESEDPPVWLTQLLQEETTYD